MVASHLLPKTPYFWLLQEKPDTECKTGKCFVSEMKWPGEDPNLLNLNNQTVQSTHGHNPPRTQDDAMIGYVFQRGTGEQPEFPGSNVPVPGKIPARWALGNEELVQVSIPNAYPWPTRYPTYGG